MMQEILDDFSVSSLLNAMEANVQEAWIRLGRGLGAVVHDEAVAEGRTTLNGGQW